jgi:peptidoglycan/LPS O-acetylase OafA/YrhL
MKSVFHEDSVFFRRNRLPSLDGWRAVSIVMVLMYHAQFTVGFPEIPLVFKWIFDGDLGVRFFFVISGFLITWLMLRESETTGTVNLRHFYIRRCFRILPVYFGFLIVLFCLQQLTTYIQSGTAWVGNLTFTTNYVTIPWTARHLWSLSVEEQFYVLWPVIFVFCAAGSSFRNGIRILAVPFVAAPIIRLIAFKHYYPDWLSLIFCHYSFFRYFDSLAVGCGIAFLIFHRFELVRRLLTAYPRIAPLVAVTFLFLPHLLARLPIPGRLIAAGGHSMQALGFAFLLVHSVFYSEAKCYRWLNWKWVSHIGVLSYSIYIWQQIFSTKPGEFGLTEAWWLSFPGWIGITLIVAHASYYLIEKPFLKLSRRFKEKSESAFNKNLESSEINKAALVKPTLDAAVLSNLP